MTDGSDALGLVAEAVGTREDLEGAVARIAGVEVDAEAKTAKGDGIGRANFKAIRRLEPVAVAPNGLLLCHLDAMVLPPLSVPRDAFPSLVINGPDAVGPRRNRFDDFLQVGSPK